MEHEQERVKAMVGSINQSIDTIDRFFCCVATVAHHVTGMTPSAQDNLADTISLIINRECSLAWIPALLQAICTIVKPARHIFMGMDNGPWMMRNYWIVLHHWSSASCSGPGQEWSGL
jgi:hypothetical protein